VEYARDIYRGDRARFVVDLRRQQADAPAAG